jgi:hypothetical protein
LGYEDKFDAIVAYWENERSKLMVLIENYVKDQEYELAHLHQQALTIVNGRLQTLKNIDDKLYDRKYFMQEGINHLHKLLDAEPQEELRAYWRNEIEKKEKELLRLNQEPKQITSITHPNIFTESLTALIDGKIRGCKLTLNKSRNLTLLFSYKKQILTIKLPYIKQLLKSWMLDDEKILQLDHLGFRMQADGKTLILQLKGERESVQYEAMLILSKVVFELFYFKVFENESFLEIVPKRKRFE